MEKHRTNVTRKKLGKKSRFHKSIPDVVSSSHKQATNDNSNTSTLFLSNFPDSFNAKDTWEIFQSYWEIQEVFIPGKRDKHGNRFGFARFVDVQDVC